MASQRWKGFVNLQEFDGKLKNVILKLKIHKKEYLEVSKQLWKLKIGMNVELGATPKPEQFGWWGTMQDF